METKQNVDLATTTSVSAPGGSVLFQQGYILRKVSKFILSSNDDGYMPIPVFYDVETKKILVETLPKEIREEYKDYSF